MVLNDTTFQSDDRPIQPTDVFIGRRLKEERKRQKMSQSRLAALAGVTFQQIQKYENGQNRISAGRLWHLARILNVPVGSFFAALPDAPVSGSADQMTATEANLLADYRKIRDPKVAETVLSLIRSLADGTSDTAA